MHTIIMPQLGQDITSARIIEWLKDEGDEVEKGETILVVESDKASFEIEAEESGVVLKILHEGDEDVEIFRPLAYIGNPGEAIPAAEEAAKVEKTSTPAPRSTAEPQAPQRAEKPGRILASPAARRVADEKGVDLGQITGTGPGGRITTDDVIEFSGRGDEELAPAAEGDTVVPFSKIRQRIADRLTLSKTTIPHFYLSVEVDMTALVDWRTGFNEKSETRITITDCVIKAAASALSRFEKMNAHVSSDKVVLKADINIGVAVSIDEGLLVPVIDRADEKSLTEIALISRANAEDARRGVIATTAPGTFTVTSLGMYGIRQFVPVINPPECAILAIGAMERRVVAVERGICAREVMTLTLAADHRAADGTYAAKFLNRIKCNLENIDETGPEWLKG